ncbi:MAG: beta-Ala-His dipeptidase [Selenomonadaceae bacterium]|nr:beta-Ala-His dipeptidase [Selenomonadaceae bacterium]MBQ9496062.1 beta-Ala-His dipeptidase [Selenomonadaceae bacterium]
MSEKILTQAAEKILDGVLEEFAKLAAIPRPSKHEAQVSNFLKKFFEQHGLKVVQDKLKNIVAEVPASPGKENFPLTILQAHMDMVCVAEEGYAFEPTKDPIKLIRGEKFLEAEGTSLGADNGVGIAEILFLTKNLDAFEHGPLRIIFTVDEEHGMNGAKALDEKFFTDAAYMINCDSERFGEIVAGSAGSVHMNFWRELHYVRPDTKLGTNMEIKIGGLRGGHSGEEISSGRVNALKLAVQLMRAITKHGKIRMSYLSGGRAFNVIPDSATFVMATDIKPDAVREVCAEVEQKIKNVYGATDPGVKIETKVIKRPDKVLHAKDYELLTNFISLMHSGIYAVNPAEPAQVLASANLGVVRMDDKIVELKVLPRANADELLEELTEGFEQAAKLCSFESKFSEPAPAWSPNPDSKLLRLAEKIFTEQNGHAPAIKVIHAGLETSFFIKKNPNLDIISIGTTNENIHSPNERLRLDTVAPHVKFIVGILEKISSAKL